MLPLAGLTLVDGNSGFGYFSYHLLATLRLIENFVLSQFSICILYIVFNLLSRTFLCFAIESSAGFVLGGVRPHLSDLSTTERLRQAQELKQVFEGLACLILQE